MGHASGLLGNNEIEQAKVEMMIDAGEDIRSRAVKLFYSPDFVRKAALWQLFKMSRSFFSLNLHLFTGQS